MTADLFFENVQVYGVTRFDAKLGQRFRVVLDEPAKWFADNDAVMDIAVDADGKGATIVATAKGLCEVQLQRADRSVALILHTSVFDVTAASLGLSAGSPELK